VLGLVAVVPTDGSGPVTALAKARESGTSMKVEEGMGGLKRKCFRGKRGDEREAVVWWRSGVVCCVSRSPSKKLSRVRTAEVGQFLSGEGAFDPQKSPRGIGERTEQVYASRNTKAAWLAMMEEAMPITSMGAAGRICTEFLRSFGKFV